MLTVLTVCVVTAVDVAVVSVDCEAVETGVVVCVVTLDKDSDIGGVVVAIVTVDTVAVNTSFGIRGTILSWIQSFITGRTQAVRVGDDQSAISSVVCGFPEGSVLGPVLFLLCTADILNIIQRHGLWTGWPLLR